MALVPLFVLPLSNKLVPGEKLNPAKVTGFLFGFLGVVLLIGGEKLFDSQSYTNFAFGTTCLCYRQLLLCDWLCYYQIVPTSQHCLIRVLWIDACQFYADTNSDMF